MSEPTKFCKDCRFLLKGWLDPIRVAKCGHPMAAKFSDDYLVTADGRQRHFCSSMRDYGACGRDAKLWEPR